MGVARAVPAALAAVAAVAAIVAPALARDPQRPRLAISPRAVVYGDAAVVDGRLVGGDANAGVAVALLERRLPGDGKYREVARARADEQGAVRFTVRPEANAYFAIRTRAEPVQTSLGLLVRVAPRIAWTATPQPAERGQTVVVAGTIAPAIEDAEVAVQRRGEHRWRTVARTTAQPADPEDAQPRESAFEAEVPLRHGGRYRVVVDATDELSRGVSDAQRLRIGAPSSAP